jgi:hypothetical protein
LKGINQEGIDYSDIIKSYTFTTNRIKMAEEVPQEVLAKADSMDDNKEFAALFDFLHEQAKAYPDNFEIMWRIARVNFDMSSEKPAQKKEYILTSFAITEKLLTLQPDNCTFILLRLIDCMQCHRCLATRFIWCRGSSP